MRYVFAFYIVMAFATITHAADRYVHCENGNDGAAGTQAAPYRTIQRAFDVVQPGETIFIHTGAVCRVTKRIQTVRNGPVTVTSYGGGDGIWKLRGSELFNSGWTNAGSNRWSHTAITNPGRMVFFDGKNQATWAETGSCPSALNSDREFCYTGGKLYVYSTSNPATRFTNPGVEVVNQLQTHSNAGDRHILQLAHANYTLKNGDIRHSGNQSIQILAGASTTLDNMDVSWSCLNNSTGSYQGGCAVIEAQLKSNIPSITFRNTRIHDCGRDCFHIGGGSGTLSNFLVENSEFYNSFNHGAIGVINQGTITKATIRRTYFHDVCNFIGQTNTAGTNNAHTLQLTIEDSYFKDGVLSTDSRVFQAKEACGGWHAGISFNGASTATSTIIRRSIFENIIIGVDIQAGHPSSTLIAENNVFYNNTKIGLDLSTAGGGMTVRNNIFSQNGGGTNPSVTQDGQITCRDAKRCSNFTSRNFSNINNNLYDPHGSSVVAYINQSSQGDRTFTQWRAVTGADTNSVNAAPNFVSAAAGNFNLQPTSSARGMASTGENIGTVLTWMNTSESGEVATNLPSPGRLRLLKPL